MLFLLFFIGLLVAGLLLLVVLAALAVGGLWWRFLRRPRPQISGRLVLAGLQAPVEVIRDRWGIPHITAQSEHDLLFAQGYVHAQDRLWQMEQNRRLLRGTLAEVVGEVALPADRFSRAIGFRRAAEAELAALPPEAVALLQAYADGVNAFIEGHQGALPLEFTLLRLRPAPWTVLDTVGWGKVMAWGLSCNWESELLRWDLARKLAPERAAALEVGYNPACPTVVKTTEGDGRDDVVTRLLAAYQEARPFLAPGAGDVGSNNWVVAPARSSTGRPILCNDPHLSPGMPSIWYENHLQCPTIHVTGVSFPGVPGVIIGHNDRIAWGVTNAFPDVQDFFVERFDPANPRRYEFQGQWEEAQVVREEIRVKGRAAPEVLEVRITRHGPVVSDVLAPAAGVPLALRWVAHDPGDIVVGVLMMNRASDWAEFQEALRHWPVPSQNFVYADVDGHTGYIMPGQVPIRAQGDGLLPVPGWDGKHEWTGYIPFEELPRLYDPPQGLIVTANNRVVGPDYPHFISAEWSAGYRARRIEEALRDRERIAPADCQALHMDFTCLPANDLLPFLDSLAPTDPLEQQALAALRAWDRRATPDSVGASIYQALVIHLLRQSFAPILGEHLDHFLGVGRMSLFPIGSFGGRAWETLIAALRGETSLVTPDLPAAFSAAVAALRLALGPNLESWQWGRLHRVSFDHAMKSVPVIGRLLSRGPYPVGGDGETPHQANFAVQWPVGPVYVTVSYRQIIDVGAWENSQSVNTTGQCGVLGSPHYADQIPLWRAGQYHPMLWRREDIQRQAEGILVLEPRA